VIPVLTCAALLAIPKAMLLPAMQLLQAAEHQKFLLVWVGFCGLIDVAIDVLLIPSHGALGAAIGNGVGQALAVAGIWVRAGQLFRLNLAPLRFLRILGCGLGMSLPVIAIARSLGGWVAIACGAVAGAVSFVVMLRLLRVLDERDAERIVRVTRRVPPPLRRLTDQLVWALSPSSIK
jgi:O-antigen/teichoic acid export membrane protein